VTEHAIPRDAVRAQDLPLGLLIAARDAARVTLVGVHLRTPMLEVVSLLGPGRVALNRPAPRLFAVRSHRSSIRSKLAFTPAYHLTTE
jgi:hypothetical protein